MSHIVTIGQVKTFLIKLLAIISRNPISRSMTEGSSAKIISRVKKLRIWLQLITSWEILEKPLIITHCH